MAATKTVPTAKVTKTIPLKRHKSLKKMSYNIRDVSKKRLLWKTKYVNLISKDVYSLFDNIWHEMGIALVQSAINFTQNDNHKMVDIEYVHMALEEHNEKKGPNAILGFKLKKKSKKDKNADDASEDPTKSRKTKKAKRSKHSATEKTNGDVDEDEAIREWDEDVNTEE